MRRNSKRKSVSKRSRKQSKNLKKRLSKSKKRSYFRIVRTDENGNQIAEPEENNAGPLTRTRAQNATGQYIPFVQGAWGQNPQVLIMANGANPAFTFHIPDPLDQLLNRYQSNTAQSNSRPVNNELTRSSRHR